MTYHIRLAREPKRPKNSYTYRPSLPRALPRPALHGGDAAECKGVGHAGRMRVGAVMQLVGTLLVLVLIMGAHPARAWASVATFANGATATIDDDTGIMTGRAHVSFYYTEGMGATFFKVGFPDGQTLVGHCISYGHYVPADGTYSFTATPKGSGTYDVVVWGQEAKSYHPISAEIDIWPAQNVGGLTWTPRLAGWIGLTKTSANTALTAQNAAYSLNNAIYGIYSDSACTVEVGRLTTDASGKATSEPLPTGTYYVKELVPSAGYALDTAVHATRVEGGKETSLTLSEVPAYAQPATLLRKLDADTATAVPQGSATLSGAVYELRLYSGFHNLDDLPANPLRTLRFSTDQTGQIPFDTSHLVEGTAYTNTAGNICLPLGTYVLEEITASNGYRSSSPTRHLVQVTRDGEGELAHTYNAPSDQEHIIRGGVVVRKRDAESHSIYPLGSGSFEDISFQLINRSARSVVIDGVSYAPGAVCMTLTTDAEGVARTAANVLPFGRYELRESGHGRGYYGNPNWSQTFDITRQGELVNLRAAGTAVEDQIRRGDIAFSKHESGSGELMAYVPFLLTSNSTGEAHVIVTDENGMLSTSSNWNRHSVHTNANDAALSVQSDGSYHLDESLLDPEAGVWFGATTLEDGASTLTSANDYLGALPYDRTSDGGGYTLQELPCSANQGHRMVSATFSITRDGYELNLGTFSDDLITLGTTLTSPGGQHVAAAGSQVILTDTVHYEGLMAGKTYQLTGELHSFSEDGSDLGVIARAEAQLSANSSEGTYELAFTVDTSGLEGCRVVAYETLSYEGAVWATHADPDDEDQTVYFPQLETVAHSRETSADDVPATAHAGVIDTVSYAGIQPGESYELRASLHLLDSDGADGGEVGTGSVEFLAESASGEVSVALEDLDLSLYAGRDLVVFEQLLQGDQVWATHANLTNLNQTVHAPAIHTQAHAAHEEGLLTVSTCEALVDTVTYENLLPNTNYQLQATVHVLDTTEGEVRDGGVIATGEPLSFTTPASQDGSETVSGSVDVPLTVDLTGLEGRSIVIFESLSRGDSLVATHEDLSDTNQTLNIPALHTTATYAGDHDMHAECGQTILDEVAYENLTPGLSYLITGSIMGFPADSDEVLSLGTVSREFIPESSSGTLTLCFEDVDARGLAGGRVVAYEVLGYEDLIVATHQNPQDENQTIYVPLIGTEALSAAGTHTAFAGNNQTITDTVHYEGLLPNHRYTATATLHALRSNLNGGFEDAGALSDPSSISFTTPEASEGESTVSGEVEVPIRAYLAEHAGENIVCYEELYRDDVIVATHTDPNDRDQRISLPRLATSATPSKPNEAGVVTVCDRISYENLVPGETYEVVGTLHRKGSNNQDLGAVCAEDGNVLTARTTFLARERTGEVEVTFSLNVEHLELAGSSVVVFEELRQNDVIVARHNEIGSVDQLVVFDNTGTPLERGPIPQTGWTELPYLVLIVLAFIALGSGLSASRDYRW